MSDVMNILFLPLKAKWYEMIESGEKKEEYREIKPYWEKRLVDYKGLTKYLEDNRYELACKRVLFPGRPLIEGDIMKTFERGYTHVKFSYGYTKRTMTFEIDEITRGEGKPEWGAKPGEYYFIIKLGKRI